MKLVLPPATPLLAVLLQSATAAALKLNITALAAHNQTSFLECWQICDPFDITTDGGFGLADLPLGNVSTLKYSVVPSGYDAGVHWASTNQFVIWIAGLTHITLPHDPTSDGVHVAAGQMIFASDTKAVSTTGHGGTFPGTTETVQIKIPTADGAIPEHEVLHSGPCAAGERLGLHAVGLPGA